ncbi:acetyl esterase/lipase [Rhodococcus sp. 27YEA15]|uniref:alpha/beta hydrolase n=1 Tax=Rhodococcus sp. 27YEA15 TaxID=3156259 RepID=UPI003C7DA362
MHALPDGSTQSTVILGPDAVIDLQTAAETVERAAGARGIAVEIHSTASAREFEAAVRSARPDTIVVPGSALLPDVVDAAFVRVDLDARRRVVTAGVRVQIRGRGLDGLRYAVDSWYFNQRKPATVRSYGEHSDQQIDLRIPDGPGPHPVAVLIHGGYWKPWWDRDLMDAAAVDLTARGFATWNVEYRRPGEYGWDATTDDVAASLAALESMADSLDLRRIAVLGHSAGGQLAFRAGADAVSSGAVVQPSLLVSLAGVLDLRTADERHLGDGAVSMALGHRYSPESATYRLSSPIERLPIGIPQLTVCGAADSSDLRDIARRYTKTASTTTDLVDIVEGPGDHFAVIDPGSELWRRTIDRMTDALT